MTNINRKPSLDPDSSYLEEKTLQDPNVVERIDKLLKFFQETGIRYNNFNIEPEEDLLKGLRRSDIVNKKAYPNVDYYMHIPGQHNMEKWMQAVKEIYHKEKNGSDRIMSIRQATGGWNTTETYDFLNWLRYYEGSSHLKYKFAQLWYENGAPGYFLHVKQDPKKETSLSIDGKDIDMVRDTIADEMPISEKKHIVEKQRNKIIGRLDSAEKLLRTHDGQIFAGKEFESLLEAIYQLKKKIQMINKISVSTKLYEDMIVREANIMNKNGFVKAAQLLFSLSQADKSSHNELGATNKLTALPTPPAPPQQSGGDVGGLPSTGPGMAQTPPESAPNETVPSKGINQFLENLNTSNIGTTDKNFDKDTLEVNDILDVDDEMIVVEAQEIPTPNLNEIKSPTTKSIDFDHMIDAAFANIKVSDVVIKLEDLAKIFKTREIPRQLSIVDMMLDSLGLAAYFPSLSEATNKALESNNYIATRIDDILAKLHGSIETKNIDLRGDQTPKTNSPELDALKQSLRTQEEKEKARKKLRKEQANQELENAIQPKETPEIDITEDLSQPIQPIKEQLTPPISTKPISTPVPK